MLQINVDIEYDISELMRGVLIITVIKTICIYLACKTDYVCN